MPCKNTNLRCIRANVFYFNMKMIPLLYTTNSNSNSNNNEISSIINKTNKQFFPCTFPSLYFKLKAAVVVVIVIVLAVEPWREVSLLYATPDRTDRRDGGLTIVITRSRLIGVLCWWLAGKMRRGERGVDSIPDAARSPLGRCKWGKIVLLLVFRWPPKMGRVTPRRSSNYLHNV